MFAAIDLGSNSFRLHIGQYVNNAFHIVKTAREPNRLALGLDENSYLTPSAITDGLQSLHNIRLILNSYPIKKIRAVATHTFRTAKNASDFLKQAQKILGISVDIISGEEEGRLVYLGVDKLLSLPQERRLVIDIGGGSTEIIRGKGAHIKKTSSYGTGTVAQHKLFFPDGVLSPQHFDTAIHAACLHFKDIQSHFQKHFWDNAYGSSGTIRAIAEIIVNKRIGNGDLNEKNLETLRNEMIKVGRIHQLFFSEIKKERNASIVGGLSIITALIQKLNISKIIPIESGLRMGILWDLCS